MQLRQYQEGHINWFYTKNNSLTGQLFVIYLFKSQKAFRMPTLFECRYLEDNLLVQSGDFCIHEYKIRFCKEVYISAYPKIVIFKNHLQ